MLGVVGQKRPDPGLIEMMDGVHEVLRISEPYKLASRTFKPEGTVVNVGDVRIGGDEVIVMAGPCSAETESQVMTTAAAVRKAGAKILRGGAFKPRSSPYAFQGLGEEGLKMLQKAAKAEGMALISEVMDISQIPLFAMLRGRLSYLSDRQKVIAENVANSDTPGYAPRDLDRGLRDTLAAIK